MEERAGEDGAQNNCQGALCGSVWVYAHSPRVFSVLPAQARPGQPPCGSLSRANAKAPPFSAWREGWGRPGRAGGWDRQIDGVRIYMR
eukprot:scaffold3181_cov389-Prasinococcus_capsulatus_cf.AAC.9